MWFITGFKNEYWIVYCHGYATLSTWLGITQTKVPSAANRDRQFCEHSIHHTTAPPPNCSAPLQPHRPAGFWLAGQRLPTRNISTRQTVPQIDEGGVGTLARSAVTTPSSPLPFSRPQISLLSFAVLGCFLNLIRTDAGAGMREQYAGFSSISVSVLQRGQRAVRKKGLVSPPRQRPEWTVKSRGED